MTATLHTVELDLLCSFAEVSAPFPLQVPSAGQTTVEQSAIFAGAARTLAERGLADASGPLGVAEDFVYLLRRCTGALDMVLTVGERRLGAVLLAFGNEALLLRQELTADEPLVRLTPVTLDRGVSSLLAMVPPAEAPMSTPFVLPKKAVADVFTALTARIPERDDDSTDIPDVNPVSAREMDNLLREHGGDERIVRRMTQH